MTTIENSSDNLTPEQKSPLGKLLRWCLTNRLVILLFVLFIIAWGLMVAPFDWNLGPILRKPVPTDAIPDIGENQQIVFTEWPGRSPQDIEDQITYPLTTALLGVPGVKTIRSSSMFGFSSIYVIFNESVEFYFSRSRLLEKLNSLPEGTLPAGVRPALGPDSTALGQIFWYTLEGRDIDGSPAGGWDLDQLRTIQDFYVRYSLLSAEGVSEAASVGGFVTEYQIDVDPDAMRAYNVTLLQIFNAVKASNIDVGAGTIELNSVEYFIRGIGFIKNIDDIENTVIKVNDSVPVLIKHIASVQTGPALRRGALDKDGTEAVGGVVVARYGVNPLAVIKNVKKKIEEISTGLPAKITVDYSLTNNDTLKHYASQHKFDAFINNDLNHNAWIKHLKTTPIEDRPAGVKLSQVTIVPFYDRTGLIYETLGTLNTALAQEILITTIVVILMLMHLRSSLIISSMLPLTVLLCFVAMKIFGVDANIVALSGIAIAIGTIVDMGIVISENILRNLENAPPDADKLNIIHAASSQVASAVLTAVATTVISFLPVFTMIGPEGKLFKPLAFTKTFALIASIIIALTVLPPAAYILYCTKLRSRTLKNITYTSITILGILILLYGFYLMSLLVIFAGFTLVLFGLYNLSVIKLPDTLKKLAPYLANIFVVLLIAILLSSYWMPLGPARGDLRNFLFVALLVGPLLVLFWLFRHFYPVILGFCLRHKTLFITCIILLVFFGATCWLGFEKIASPVPAVAQKLGFDPQKIFLTTFWYNAVHKFPSLGKEFMPPLDEGSFLYMPTTMTHASIGEALDVLSKQDIALTNIPEVDSVVGKIGRVKSPLDPAPVSMIETVINYKPEFITDYTGRPIRFKYNKKTNLFERDEKNNLIPDKNGRPYRQWRDEIKSPDDIWDQIVKAGQIPGTTSAPKLQPIAARIVMLQSGMRAPMGVKIKGPDLNTIERTGLAIEKFLRQVPSVDSSTVFADRIIGKPYLEIIPDRNAIARYGIMIDRFQQIIEIALGGKTVTSTVEGRQRFAVRVRYARELRDSIETIDKILVPAQDGTHIPLTQLAEIKYVRGPQVIKSEDTFLVGYVLFDKKPGHAEVDVVNQCQSFLNEKIDTSQLIIAPGTSFSFAGTYENQVRSQKTLAVVLPLALFLIFIILYFQFKSTVTTLLVFSGIFVAWSGGFILLWLYAQPWFLDFNIFDVSIRNLFQIHPVNLSVAVWVGFLALFGIATDDGVVQSTYLNQHFRETNPETVEKIRAATIQAAQRRIRPCLMTSATTILALVPVLTSTGRGSDVMVPMAIPSFGGMLVVLLSVLVVPTLYCLKEEIKLKRSKNI